MAERGWAKTESEALRVALLIWLDGQKGRHIVPVSEFLDERAADMSDDEIEDLVTPLGAIDLLDVRKYIGPGWRGTRLTLTPDGKTEVQALREMSEDADQREVQCRDALLYWLNKVRRIDTSKSWTLQDFVQDPSSRIGDTLFEINEIEEASKYLAAKGLIKLPELGRLAPGRHWSPRITEEGIDCVQGFEGDVRAYLRARIMPPMTPMTQYNVTVSGGQGIIVGPGGQVVQKFGADVQDLIPLIADVLNALAGEQGDDPDRMRVLMQAIENELADDEPSTELIRSTGDKLKSVAGRFGNAAISAAVGMFFSAMAKHYGWR